MKTKQLHVLQLGAIEISRFDIRIAARYLICDLELHIDRNRKTRRTNAGKCRYGDVLIISFITNFIFIRKDARRNFGSE